MKQKQGFTLVELLVVLSIMSLLTAAIFLNLNHLWQRQQEVRIQHDLLQLEVAAANYLAAEPAAQWGEIDQGQLLAQGYLAVRITAPLADYQYQILLCGQEQLPQVSLCNGHGIYSRGSFRACNW